MYYRVVAQSTQNLKQVQAWLDAAENHARTKRFDISVLLSARLAPDMKPFTYQVQSASDYIKAAAAWLSGRTPPRYLDTEQTVAEVRARIDKTVAFVEGITEGEFASAPERKVSLSWEPGKVIGGPDYLVQVTIPNVYFHLTTAYAILRHNGVEIGKMDFLGRLNMVDS